MSKRTLSFTLIVAALSAALCLAGCQKQEQAATEAEGPREGHEAQTETVAPALNTSEPIHEVVTPEIDKEKINSITKISDLCIVNPETQELTDYIVYVSENGVYTPYMVLSNDYDGKTLLLRANVLGDPVFCYGEGAAGYEGSLGDTMVNNDVFNTLSEGVRGIVSDTNIDVLSSDGAASGDVSAVKTIQRKMFLLSATEFEAAAEGAPVEGKGLSAFDPRKDGSGNSKIYSSMSELDPPNDKYWTRTVIPANGAVNYCAVSIKGEVETAPMAPDAMKYLRPAFCVPSDSEVKPEPAVSLGGVAYVLSVDNG